MDERLPRSGCATGATPVDHALAALLQADEDLRTGRPITMMGVPAWAVAYDSAAEGWRLTPPAVAVVELLRTPDLHHLQTRLLAWATTTYGPQSLERRGLVIAEEAGEVARVILKTAEGIRPSTRGDLGEELAQLVVAILVTAELAGIDLTARLPVVVERLMARSVEREQGGAP